MQLLTCGIAVAELHFFKKLQQCDCGSTIFKLQNCSWGPQKKLQLPTSGYTNCLCCDQAQYQRLLCNSKLIHKKKFICDKVYNFKVSFLYVTYFILNIFIHKAFYKYYILYITIITCNIFTCIEKNNNNIYK